MAKNRKNIQFEAYNGQELALLHDDNLQWYLGVHLGRVAQPQASGSGACLKKLFIKVFILILFSVI